MDNNHHKGNNPQNVEGKQSGNSIPSIPIDGNRTYIENFMWNYTKESSHIRGCMLEGLIGELDRRMVPHETFIEILSRIACDMK